MVLTRRGSRSVGSLDNNDDAGSASRASARGGGSRHPPPPPPPPPPGPPPLPDPPQPQQQQPAANNGNGREGMAPIPEEVAMNNNNGNLSGESSGVGVVGGNYTAVEEANRNNAQVPHPPPPVRYLLVRVPPSHSLRPSRVHRWHRQDRPSTANHMPNNNIRRRSGKGRGGPSSEQCPSSGDGGEIVRLLIPPGGFASERQLAECLSQAGAADVPAHDPGGWNDDFGDDYSVDEFFDEPTPHVAGIFTERDRVFVPLSIIYSNPTSFIDEVLCLRRPPPLKRPVPVNVSSTTKTRSIFITVLELLGIAVVATASWWTYGAAQHVDWDYILGEAAYGVEWCFFAVINFPFWLFNAVIEIPLREIYRHGPSALGWEGEPLPRICARITYHGDENFWSRNIEECEQIYKAREASAMQVRKPIVIGLLLFVLFSMARSIVAARALRRRERVDPNMVETYRAIQMLTRQLRRAAANAS